MQILTRRSRVISQHDVQHVELVEELDALLYAVLVERLQDHVAGTVRRIAGAAHGRLAVVTGVTTETALVDPPLRRAVERQAHLLEVENRVDRFLAHDLGRVLVDEVVAAFDGVERVPLPVVVLDIGQRGTHPALRCSRVGPGGVELGENGGAGPLGRFDGGAHAGTAGADDDHVISMELHDAPYQPVMVGSNVKMTNVPTPKVSTTDAASSTDNQKRVPGLRE